MKTSALNKLAQMPVNHQIVLDCLPDIPRWIEARSMLLNGRGMVLAFHSDPETGSECSAERRAETKGALLQQDIGLGVVIGKPDMDLIFQLSELADEIICPIENAVHCAKALNGWSKEAATIFLRDDQIPLPQLATSHQRVLRTGELTEIDDLPELLFEELEEEQQAGTKIYCATEDDRPLAFCYPGSLSETYWDISIDTLEAHRREGHATRSVIYAINQMEKQHRKPAWAAVDSNTGSRAMAGSLGFTSIDRLMVFTRNPDLAV